MGKIHEALQKASSATAYEDDIGERQQEIAVQTNIEMIPSSQAAETSPAPLPKISTEDENQVSFSEAPLFSSWDERLRLAMEPSSTVAESFRKLRTKILHPDAGEPPRTILITSAVPEEGKGFATANLGCAIAQGMEKSCLVVDCDLRRPTLSGLFGYSGQEGLSQYLKGELVDWQKIVLPTALEKLSVIPSGPSPKNPAELIDSACMRELLAQLVAEQEDRLILVDSPPLQAAAETAILAKLVDNVVLVVRWGKAGREQIQNLITAIGREKIIGIVFNAFELNALDSALLKKGYYGYSGYYGRNY